MRHENYADQLTKSHIIKKASKGTDSVYEAVKKEEGNSSNHDIQRSEVSKQDGTFKLVLL